MWSAFREFLMVFDRPLIVVGAALLLGVPWQVAGVCTLLVMFVLISREHPWQAALVILVSAELICEGLGYPRFLGGSVVLALALVNLLPEVGAPMLVGITVVLILTNGIPIDYTGHPELNRTAVMEFLVVSNVFLGLFDVSSLVLLLDKVVDKIGKQRDQVKAGVQ